MSVRPVVRGMMLCEHVIVEEVRTGLHPTGEEPPWTPTRIAAWRRQLEAIRDFGPIEDRAQAESGLRRLAEMEALLKQKKNDGTENS